MNERTKLNNEQIAALQEVVGARTYSVAIPQNYSAKSRLSPRN